jgi:hypothetical protein
MEISRNLIIYISASLLIGLFVGYLLPQSQINSLYQEVITSQNILNEKDQQLTQLEEQVITHESKIEKMDSEVQKYESDIKTLNTEIRQLENNYENLEKDYNEVIELYNNVYYLENSYIATDFSKFSEVDPDNKITVNTSRIYWNEMDRSISRKVYKEYEEDYFGDFKHLMDFRLNEVDPGDTDLRTIIELWSLCNEENRDDNSNSIILSTEQVGIFPDRFKIVFTQRVKGEIKFSYSYFEALETGVTYYATISRRDNLCQLELFSDPERTNIILDTGLKLGADSKYSYLQLSTSNTHLGDFLDSSSGFIENLRIKTY